MTYTVEALGDFMRVGPQVYPARPNGVQVIMRGPHGQRFAADPVRTREGRARGSGFRFWVEQLNVPADEKWNPKQRVVGLLGLGAGKPPRSAALTQFAALYTNWKATRDASVRATLLASAKNVWRELTPDERENFSAEMQTMTIGSGDRTVYNQEVADLRETQANLDFSAARLEAARRAAAAAKARGGETWQEQFDWRDVPSPSGIMDKIPFVKIGLAVAGGLALYGLVSGFGKGLATRAFRSKES